MNTDIPRISLEALDADSAHHETMLARLADASARWGFFRLVDHGISAAETVEFLDQVNAFFRLPSEDKQALLRTAENPWGYFDNELTKNRQDWKEIYDIGTDYRSSDANVSTPWPTALPLLQPAMAAWRERCEEVSEKLLSAICKTLNEPAHQLLPFFSPDNTSFLRLNFYPLCDDPAEAEEAFPEAGHLGIHHHTDAGALTVLLQDDVAGLQVMFENRWHTIQPEPGSLIINIGDLVQVWSNDRYKAPLHRVLANQTDERISAAYFYNPSFNTDCQPLGNTEPNYRTINWGEFRSARAAGDYADVGEEVQISHYRLI